MSMFLSSKAMGLTLLRRGVLPRTRVRNFQPDGHSIARTWCLPLTAMACWGIFKQRIDQDTPELVATMPEGVEETRMNPDGAWALLVVPTKKGSPSQADKLMRVPITGGFPQLVLTAAIYDQPSCSRSPATLCAIAERTGDHKQLIFTAFDPVKGRGSELTRLGIDADAAYTWDLSPDATRIAALKLTEGRIHILSLTGQPSQEITVKGWSSLQCVDWTADGKGLFVSSAGKETSVLLYVDLQGNARVLWEHGGWGGHEASLHRMADTWQCWALPTLPTFG